MSRCRPVHVGLLPFSLLRERERATTNRALHNREGNKLQIRQQPGQQQQNRATTMATRKVQGGQQIGGKSRQFCCPLLPSVFALKKGEIACHS